MRCTAEFETFDAQRSRLIHAANAEQLTCLAKCILSLVASIVSLHR